MITGIYAIWRKGTKNIYIGSAAISLIYRFNDHKKQLKANKHKNKHLQNAWNKYKDHCFEFIILEKCIPNKCIVIEQFYINAFKERGYKLYNVCLVAGNRLGVKHTRKSKEKIGQSNLDRKSIVCVFMSPNKIIYENIRNIKQFASDHNLDRGTLNLVSRSKLKQHKGWICISRMEGVTTNEGL